jgi:hypothetical protein
VVAALAVAVAVALLPLVTSVPSVAETVPAMLVLAAWAWVVVVEWAVAWAAATQATAAAAAWAWVAAWVVAEATATRAALPAGGRTSAPHRPSRIRHRCCAEHQPFSFSAFFFRLAIKRALPLGYQISMIDLLQLSGLTA